MQKKYLLKTDLVAFVEPEDLEPVFPHFIQKGFIIYLGNKYV